MESCCPLDWEICVSNETGFICSDPFTGFAANELCKREREQRPLSSLMRAGIHPDTYFPKTVSYGFRGCFLPVEDDSPPIAFSLAVLTMVAVGGGALPSPGDRRPRGVTCGDGSGQGSPILFQTASHASWRLALVASWGWQ